jgi:hypothetical protein
MKLYASFVFNLISISERYSEEKLLSVKKAGVGSKKGEVLMLQYKSVSWLLPCEHVREKRVQCRSLLSRRINVERAIGSGTQAKLVESIKGLINQDV